MCSLSLSSLFGFAIFHCAFLFSLMASGPWRPNASCSRRADVQLVRSCWRPSYPSSRRFILFWRISRLLYSFSMSNSVLLGCPFRDRFSSAMRLRSSSAFFRASAAASSLALLRPASLAACLRSSSASCGRLLDGGLNLMCFCVVKRASPTDIVLPFGKTATFCPFFPYPQPSKRSMPPPACSF